MPRRLARAFDINGLAQPAGPSMAIVIPTREIVSTHRVVHQNTFSPGRLVGDESPTPLLQVSDSMIRSAP